VARRSRSSINPLWLLAGLAVLVAGVAAGSFFLSEASSPFRTIDTLEINAYLENSNSLRGNVYKVQGEVLNVIAYSPTSGRLISVGIDKNKEIVPMLIPAALGHENIQIGQRFHFMIEVSDNGILRVRELIKA
jgi:hypothetical protein